MPLSNCRCGVWRNNQVQFQIGYLFTLLVILLDGGQGEADSHMFIKFRPA